METTEIVAKIVVPSLTGAGAVYRLFLHRRVRLAIERRKTRDQNIARIPEVLDSLHQIQAELRTNGGGSLRDEIRAIATKNATNEQRIRALLQSTNEPVFETNAVGEWVWVNRTMVNMTGRLSEEMYGNGWKNLVDPADRATVAEEWKFATRDKRECIVRFRLVNRLMKASWVILHSFPVRGAEPDAVVGYFGWVTLDMGQTAASAAAAAAGGRE
jgi:PAS domain S-box-containing protein